VTTAEIALDPQVRADSESTDEPEARIMDHAYDGIREYDNPLPGWWKSIFLGSIMFAGFYGLYFHLTDWGRTPQQEYRSALTDYESKKDLRDRADAANVSEKSLAAAAHDPKVTEHGAQVFKTKCVTCHAEDGRGLIGPNLTDFQQIHGTTRMDLHSTITRGVPGTAMLAWGEQMPQTEILAVAAFVITLRGRNFPGKPGQGAPVERFEP
jgi:cytochrome c oxidase cbb3-type subunit 3